MYTPTNEKQQYRAQMPTIFKLADDHFDFYMPASGAAVGVGLVVMTYGHNPAVAGICAVGSVASAFMAFQALASTITKRLDGNAAKLQARIKSLELKLENKIDDIEDKIDLTQDPSGTAPDRRTATSQNEGIISKLQP